MTKYLIVSLLILQLALIALSSSSDRVLIKEVTALTLNSGQLTTGRRSSPVPQLQCLGGKIKFLFIYLGNN